MLSRVRVSFGAYSLDAWLGPCDCQVDDMGEDIITGGCGKRLEGNMEEARLEKGKHWFGDQIVSIFCPT